MPKTSDSGAPSSVDPGAPSSVDPGALAETLAALPVAIERVEAHASRAAAVDYPAGARPSGLVRLSGRGAVGVGECVAFTLAEQERFAAEAAAWLLARDGRVGDLIAPADAGLPAFDRYARAAVEGALLDLALRQAGRTLADLTGVAAARLRYVVSFGPCAEPAARVRAFIGRLAAASGGEEAGKLAHTASRTWARFKVDVDPRWTARAIDALVASGSVEILDFKERGDPALAEALAARFPGALLEDPPAAHLAPARVTRDLPILDEEEAARAAARGEGVNLKAPRMGGFLVVLRALARVRAVGSGAAVYFGGMFEVGCGRRQSRQLAALLTAAAPNDLAPIAPGEPLAASPLSIRLDTAGFGGAREPLAATPGRS